MKHNTTHTMLADGRPGVKCTDCGEIRDDSDWFKFFDCPPSDDRLDALRDFLEPEDVPEGYLVETRLTATDQAVIHPGTESDRAESPADRDDDAPHVLTRRMLPRDDALELLACHARTPIGAACDSTPSVTIERDRIVFDDGQQLKFKNGNVIYVK